MKVSFEEVERLLKQKMKKSQIIFSIAISIGIGVFLYGSIYNRSLLYMGLSLYFLILGALTLPNINSCKKDIYNYKKNNLNEVTGKVLDIFPEKESKEGNKVWYIFLQVNENKNYIEFSISNKPDSTIAIEKNVRIRYTKATQLPVEVEVIEQINEAEDIKTIK